MTSPHSRRLSRWSTAEWTNEHEELVKQWSRTCVYYEVMHTRASRYYFTRHFILGGSAVFIGSIASMLKFLTFASTDQFLSIASGVMVLVITGLVALQNFLRYDDRSRDHKEKSVQYAELKQDIDSALTFPRDTRDPVRIFLSNIGERLRALKRDSTIVPQHIIDKFYSDIDKVLAQEGVPTVPRTVVEAAEVAEITEHQRSPSEVPEGYRYHDPLAENMEHQIQARRKLAEEYQLERLNSNTGGLLGTQNLK